MFHLTQVLEIKDPGDCESVPLKRQDSSLYRFLLRQDDCITKILSNISWSKAGLQKTGIREVYIYIYIYIYIKIRNANFLILWNAKSGYFD